MNSMQSLLDDIKPEFEPPGCLYSLDELDKARTNWFGEYTVHATPAVIKHQENVVMIIGNDEYHILGNYIDKKSFSTISGTLDYVLRKIHDSYIWTLKQAEDYFYTEHGKRRQIDIHSRDNSTITINVYNPQNGYDKSIIGKLPLSKSHINREMRRIYNE